MRTRTTVAALAAAASLATAAPAAADSISYVKGHNVWISNPDGSGQYQVTTDGSASRPYRSPSQADDGTIVASHGNDIVRLRQNGQVLSSFDPPGTTDSAGQYIDGVPVDVAVSPDGRMVAFTYYQYGCPVGASCGARTVTLYSYSDRATPVSQFGRQFRRNPSWVSNSRALIFNGYLSQVNYDSPGGGDDDDVHWFDDEDIHSPPRDLGDGELSRQGDRLVTLRDYGSDTHLMFYKVNGNAVSGSPSTPSEACFTGADGSLDNPTWSPDGRTIAFAVSAGIETMPLPNVVAGDCPGASSSRLAIPGASQPDFGPAAVNPGPRFSGVAGGATGKAKSCKRLKGVKRDRCVRKAAIAKCKRLPRKRRAKCIKKAKRSYALKQCKRKKGKKARSRCTAAVKRRYR
jgi:Tol biopolymer transport system component